MQFSNMISNDDRPAPRKVFMKIVIFTLTILFCFAATALSQAVPSPSPTPAEEGVVKIETNLIQIDVTVTGKNGKVITDLRPDEISIYENGKKQEISNFSFVSNVRETTTRTPRPNVATAPVPVTPPKPENTRRTIALVVDD